MCSVYPRAIAAQKTTKTVSLDEMTGIQALERIAPSLPIKPSKVERCEFEYVRHGTRTEDFVSFLDGLLRTGAPAMRWRIVYENLDGTVKLTDGR